MPPLDNWASVYVSEFYTMCVSVHLVCKFPLCVARLQERVTALQEQHEEEQRSARREVLQLQDELQQACEQRQEAQRELLGLREALENTTSAKVKQHLC